MHAMPGELKYVHEEWEDTDDDSKDDCRQLSEPAVTPRKHMARKPVPSSSSPSKEPLGGRRSLPRDRFHVKLPADRSSRWKRTLSSVLLFFIAYISEILRVALVWMRQPLSLILVGYSLAIMISHLKHTFTETLKSTFEPLCILPGISHLPICHLPLEDSGLSLPSRRPHDIPQHADFPALIDIQSASFDQLLDKSVGGAGLALEIKRAEMATSDLTTLVRVSDLSSRDQIAETLDTFVNAARHTARGLQRFSAKVGGAVDSIVAVNDYALRQIEDASVDSNQYWPSIWIPFSHRSNSLAAVTKSFMQTMNVLEAELYTLILAAEASLHDLDVLEEQLRLLHAIVSREDSSLNVSKEELLSSLWTRLGGNRAELRRFETHLELLSGLAEYRRHALAHVVGALHTLQTMSAELEALRERVSQPVMLGDTIPLEVHVKSIRGGLDRLINGRLEVKKLEDGRYAKLLAPLGK